MDRKLLGCAIGAVVALGAASAGAISNGRGACGGSAKELVGKFIFFDQNLSLNRNQACAACHAPAVGWTGPDFNVNLTGAVYEGSIPGQFGNRKPPSAAYGGNSPVLRFDPAQGWVGGMFWDGRATGATLGDPLAEQAQGPFLNPREQALPDAAELVSRVCGSSYGTLFRLAWGRDACLGATALDYARIGRSVAAYERSPEVSAFTSKYDAYLAGRVGLTAEEQRGLELFETTGGCSACHPSQPSPAGEPPLFTDFTYDNLGVPKNPLNPVYLWNGTDWVDPGLGGFLQSLSPAVDYASEWGKFKVPTLRNVDARPKVERNFVKAYGHNGYFKSLKEIVHFYNTRDVDSLWPAPEYAPTVNKTEMGNLGLTSQDEDAIVAFLKTLTDGYFKAPKCR